MKKREILGLEGAVANWEGLKYCLCFAYKENRIGQGSQCLMQLGPPDPLEEYASQFPDTKVLYGALQWEAHKIHHCGGPQSGLLYHNFSM